MFSRSTTICLSTAGIRYGSCIRIVSTMPCVLFGVLSGVEGVTILPSVAVPRDLCHTALISAELNQHLRRAQQGMVVACSHRSAALKWVGG